MFQTLPTAEPTLAAAASSALLAHPAVADAQVGHTPAGETCAWVVPERGRGRIPASGSCTVVTDNGVAVESALVDLSYEGVRVRCAGTPPEVGAPVQMVIDSQALGGIDGRLGVVRWRHGRDLGIAFQGNFDEAHDLVRFVQQFVEAAEDRQATEPEISPQTRVRFEVGCVVHLGQAGSCAARTVDLSATGLLVELALSPSVDWRDERVTIELELPQAPRIRGVVVRQDGARLGIGLETDSTVAAFLCDLVRASVRDTTVSRGALRAWLAAHRMPIPAHIEIVDAIPRGQDGAVDVARLGASG